MSPSGPAPRDLCIPVETKFTDPNNSALVCGNALRLRLVIDVHIDGRQILLHVREVGPDEPRVQPRVAGRFSGVDVEDVAETAGREAPETFLASRYAPAAFEG